jgi:hypothetical protein
MYLVPIENIPKLIGTKLQVSDVFTNKKEFNMDNTVIFLNQKDLAKRWSISDKTLEKWRVYGKGPRYCKVSNRVLYSISDIEAYEAPRFFNHTSEASFANRGNS